MNEHSDADTAPTPNDSWLVISLWLLVLVMIWCLFVIFIDVECVQSGKDGNKIQGIVMVALNSYSVCDGNLPWRGMGSGMGSDHTVRLTMTGALARCVKPCVSFSKTGTLSVTILVLTAVAKHCVEMPGRRTQSSSLSKSPPRRWLS